MIKTLLKSVRQYKKQTLLSPVFVAGEVILECMIPLVMSRMIDRMSAESISPIIKYGVILIMATVSLDLVYWPRATQRKHPVVLRKT